MIHITLQVKFNNEAGYRIGSLMYADENNNVHVMCSGEEIVVPCADIIQEEIRYD